MDSYSRTRPGQELIWRVKIITGFLIFCRIHLYLDLHHNAKGRAVLSTILSSFFQITGGKGDSLCCRDSTSSVTAVPLKHEGFFQCSCLMWVFYFKILKWFNMQGESTLYPF